MIYQRLSLREEDVPPSGEGRRKGVSGMTRAKRRWVDGEKHQCRLDVICSDIEELTDAPALQNEGKDDRKAWR